jgi:ATP-dependent DNA helicase RecG
LKQIAAIVNRKLSFFTEQRVLPFLRMDQLRPDLFDRARALMRSHDPQHPWLSMDNERILVVGGFVRDDPFTG